VRRARQQETGLPSTTSFLLYLEDVPEGEGGETEFLRSVDGGGGRDTDDNVLWSVRPQQGSILIFPHDTPHQGAGVGFHPKIILRGDWCAACLISGRLPGWTPYMPATLCSARTRTEDACAM